MRKKYIYTACTFICILVFSLIFQISNKSKIDLELLKSRQKLPQFSFFNENYSLFTNNDLKKNHYLIIFYYNVFCEHCQYEALDLKKNIVLFKSFEILMISNNDPQIVKKFKRESGLDDYQFIYWLYDKNNSFHQWFGRAIVPSKYIYYKSSLLNEYHGEVKMETILKHINDKES